MPAPPPLTSHRLILRAFTRAELEADLVSRDAFARAAEMNVAPGWPAKHWDSSAVQWLLDKMTKFPDEPFWHARAVIIRSEGPSGSDLLIGTAGFKGPPDDQGFVEVGYGIVDSHWRRGIATEATSMLVQWSLTDPRVKGLCAHTLAGDPASSGVLKKNGFTFTSRVTDPTDGEIDRYERTSPQRNYPAAIARVKQLVNTAGAKLLTRHDRMAILTRAYWESFGSADPTSASDLRAGRGVSWCGFYDIVPDPHAPPTEMTLVCREPKPACSPIGLHGMCGRTCREQRPFIVRDVRVLGANYVACDPKDQSELVVPVFENNACVAVFDVDSYHIGAFTQSDVDGAIGMMQAAGLGTSNRADATPRGTVTI